MTDPRASKNQSPPTRWWLSTDGVSQGPYNHAYIVACLKTGQFGGTTLVCPEGGQQWKPIVEWPAFAVVLAHSSTPPSATAQPFVAQLSDEPTRDGDDGLVTNRRLPTMANWICVYCIVVSPSLCVIDIASTLATGFQSSAEVFFGVLFTAISTLVTVMLFVGGLHLRNLRSSGPRFIKAGLWTSLATFVLAIPIMLIAFAVSAAAPEEPAPLTPFDAIMCLLYPAYVAAMVFHVVSLVWLTKNIKQLPVLKT
jgi:hypothetical protein